MQQGGKWNDDICEKVGVESYYMCEKEPRLCKNTYLDFLIMILIIVISVCVLLLLMGGFSHLIRIRNRTNKLLVCCNYGDTDEEEKGSYVSLDLFETN